MALAKLNDDWAELDHDVANGVKGAKAKRLKMIKYSELPTFIPSPTCLRDHHKLNPEFGRAYNDACMALEASQLAKTGYCHLCFLSDSLFSFFVSGLKIDDDSEGNSTHGVEILVLERLFSMEKLNYITSECHDPVLTLLEALIEDGYLDTFWTGLLRDQEKPQGALISDVFT